MSEEEKARDESSVSGVSFKLQKSSRGNKKMIGNLIDDSTVDENRKKDYLLSVEDNQLHSVIPKPAAKEFIIPLIRKNKWRILSQVNEKNRDDMSTKDKGGSKDNENKRSEQERQETDLDKQAAQAILKDLESGKFSEGIMQRGEDENGLVVPLLMQNKPPVEYEEDKLNDLDLRPEQSSMDDYEDMPIDQFGAAMLKGMGWKPGEAIGLNKKGLVEPIEFIPHPGGLGLGATPKPPEPKKNKIKKPGEIERKRPMPYKDKDGRVKHIKTIGEEIPEQKPEGFYPGNYSKVIGGAHTGLYGKIIAVDEDNARVVLKLVINRENITFSQYHLELVSEEEFKKYGRSSIAAPPEKQYGLIKPGDHSRMSGTEDIRYSTNNSSKHNHSRRKETERRDDIEESDKRSREQRESRRKDYNRTEEVNLKRDSNSARDKDRRGSRYNEKDRHSANYRREREDLKESRISSRHQDTNSEIPVSKRTKYDDYNESVAVTDDRDSKVRVSKSKKYDDDLELDYSEKIKTSHDSDGRNKCWITGQLKVRIVDQRYRNGRYYNKKLIVIDVVDLNSCICQTENGEILEGIQLHMLETVIPKTLKSTVMIVRGKDKGQLATIVEKNGSKCLATVQVNLTQEIIVIDYDDICEYTGETD